MSLWLPILLSAVFVFVVSSFIHMALKYHRNDFRKLPSEDQVMDALRPFGIPPGDYVVPYAGSTEVMKSPEFTDKVSKGPVAFMTVLENGPFAMGESLVMWFLYSVVVGGQCFALWAPWPSRGTDLRCCRTPSGTGATGQQR
jgi:hypothetical protein